MNSVASSRIILVVEDEWLVRQTSADELADAGYEVREAANAQEALAILEVEARVAVVFTDVNMPGDLDGLGWRGSWWCAGRGCDCWSPRAGRWWGRATYPTTAASSPSPIR
jgi:hypothetical protein